VNSEQANSILASQFCTIRPWVYNLETVKSIAASIAEGASKKEACEKAGVAYSSFMRWQRQKRSLQRLLEEAAEMWRDNQRIDRDLKVLLSEEPPELDPRSHLHNRRPYRDPNAQPVKWMKLIQWWLVDRVPIDVMITLEVEAAACMRFKIPQSKWEEAKKRFPRLLPKVNQKRLRRMECVLATGKLPPQGWTPPDLKNRSTQNVAPYTPFWKHGRSNTGSNPVRVVLGASC